MAADQSDCTELKMTFGSELQGQLEAINQFLISGVHLVTDFRDYSRERAQAEKEYSNRIVGLAKKYSARLDKSSGSVAQSGSDSAASAEGADGRYTCVKAWTSFLQASESIAAAHATFSDSLVSDVADPLKVLMNKKDEARKKHMIFASKLEGEKDQVFLEMEKSRSRYEEACANCDAAKDRLEKTLDEKSQDKMKKIFEQAQIDRRNASNEYSLAVSVANALKAKYYRQDIPTLMDNMQVLNESRIAGFAALLQEFIDLEISCTQERISLLEKSRERVDKVNGPADSEAFVKYILEIKPNQSSWTEPTDHGFASNSHYQDEMALVVDENSKVFLVNKLNKLKARIELSNKEMAPINKTVSGLDSLKDAYTKNPEHGDAANVEEELLEYRRNLTVMMSHRVAAETQMAVINAAIGDTQAGSPHDFKSGSFAIPATCDFCQNTIFGFGKQGYTCVDCGYSCHLKCEMKVPQTCSKSKSSGKSPSRTTSTSSKRISMYPKNNEETSSSGHSATSSISSRNSGHSDSITSGGAGVTAAAEHAVKYKAVVLYDYEAVTPEELTLHAGDKIEVLDEDDGSGWVTVSMGSKQGLYPASYVEKVDSAAKTSAPAVASKDTVAEKVRAIYEFIGGSASELSIQPGDVITVTYKGADGWWEGELNGSKGVFPGSYVEPM